MGGSRFVQPERAWDLFRGGVRGLGDISEVRLGA